MELVQSRIVTDDVEGLARFYAMLLEAPVALNDYYVEVPAGATSVGFSRCRFTEEHGPKASCASARVARRGETILDFRVDAVDPEFHRIDALGVEWVMGPTDQPWGTRSAIFRDPQGHLINVFSRREEQR